MRILYVIGKYITFPGAFIRAFWEQLTCLLLSLPVEHKGYLRANEMCGHIEHILPKKAAAAYISATAPGVMGLISGLPLTVFGFINLRILGFAPADSVWLFILYIVILYVGISIMCCLFPQFEVAQNLWDITLEKLASKEAKAKIGGIFMFLPALFTYVGAILERFSVPVVIWIVGTVIIFVL